MFEPREWNQLLAPGVEWRLAYSAVERRTRALLTTFTVGEYLTTNELAQLLYPEEYARGDGILARRRLFKALLALATRGLADCARRGEPRVMGKLRKTIRPWLWSAPQVEFNSEVRDVVLCPHCGGVV